MATFVSTTLAKRTGAGTTVFSPLGIDGGVGTLADASAAYQRLGSNITMSSKRTGNNKRITRVRVSVPLLNTSGEVTYVSSSAIADITLTVPDGTPTANVNDLAGYVAELFSTEIENFNDLLVNGEGVW